MRPGTLKQAVERIIAGEDQFIAIPEFLDEFYMSGNRQPMIDEEPAFTGMQPLDRGFAAVPRYPFPP